MIKYEVLISIQKMFVQCRVVSLKNILTNNKNRPSRLNLYLFVHKRIYISICMKKYKEKVYHLGSGGAWEGFIGG